MLSFPDFKAANAHDYRGLPANRLMGFLPTWGPLGPAAARRRTSPGALFDLINVEATKAIAAQNTIDWTTLYGVHKDTAFDPSTLVATIVMAVINVLCPATAPFDTFLEPILAEIITLILANMQKAAAASASPADFGVTVQRWGMEAQAA